MAAPTVIKWSDAGSPMLSRVASSFIGVLDYCLLRRGWTKDFSGAGKAVYRAGTGERKFYRLLNDGSFYYSTATYQYCHAKITAYDSMSDVDTGAGQWDEAYVTLSNSGTAVSRPWVCIFNETAVLLVILPHLTDNATAANSVVFGFGETLPALPGNTARNFLAAGLLLSPLQNSSAISCPSAQLVYSGLNPIGCNRSLDGSRTAINTGLIVNGGRPGVSSGSNSPFAAIDTTILSYPYNGELLYGRPMLDDGLDNSMGDYIPGLFYPCQKSSGFNNLGSYTSGQTTFVAVRVIACYAGMGLTGATTAYLGAILISLSGDHWS